MQRRLLPAVVEGASDRLAVDGHHLALEPVRERADPGREPGLERIGVDQHEHAPERVVRGNAVRQFQKGPEPSQLAAAIQGDVVPALGAGDHGTHGDHQHLDQAMLDLAGAARVLDRNKIPSQLLDRHALLPRNREGASSYARARQTREISCVAPDVSSNCTKTRMNPVSALLTLKVGPFFHADLQPMLLLPVVKAA